MPQALVIPPAVLGLAALSWPARLVLAEILALQQAEGTVHASDCHFTHRLPGLRLRTVQAAVKELADAGLITRETNQRAHHKRILTPASK
jgi:DNA-binding transcriptional ArsR family regulator